MADWDGYVTERSAQPFFEVDGFADQGLNSNAHDGFITERTSIRPFYEVDGSSYCTCVQSSTPIHTVSISAAANQVTVQFSASIVLSGPALETDNWVIVTNTDGARLVTVNSIEVSGNDVILTTTPQSDGASYTLELPTIGITDSSFDPFAGLFSLDFTGVPTIVAVNMVKTIDARTIDVIFATPVNEADASNPANYSVDHGLEVTAAVRITDFWYRLTTTRQTNDVVYTLTASNIGPL